MHEHIDGDVAVPLNERRSASTMALVWITMVTGFPTVLAGFQWFKDGLSFWQVLLCTTISAILLLLYAVPACHLGAMTGKSYSQLVRSVFGEKGSLVVSFNLIWIFVCWYGLTSLFLAEALIGLYHWTVPLVLLAPTLAFLMSLNNFWGFKGIANFARYFAAPILILWVGYSFFKALSATQISVFFEPSHCSFFPALTAVTSFVIGWATWGNEADYWRYGKPKLMSSFVPLAIAIVVGNLIFPVTGWLIARMTGITEYVAATNFMNVYSFGGFTILAALTIGASYFAANDSNLFGSSATLKALRPMPHKMAVFILAVLGATMAGLLAKTGAAHSLESVAALSCIIVPCPTVIVLCEYFVVSRFIRSELRRFQWNWIALSSLFCGIGLGVLTAGIIPGLESFKFGICSVQSWIFAMSVYGCLRLLESRLQTLSSPELEFGCDNSLVELVRLD